MTNNKIEILLSNGYESFKLKKFSEAITFFKKAYKIDVNYSKTLFLLGITNAELKNLEEAKERL